MQSQQTFHGTFIHFHSVTFWSTHLSFLIPKTKYTWIDKMGFTFSCDIQLLESVAKHAKHSKSMDFQYPPQIVGLFTRIYFKFPLV